MVQNSGIWSAAIRCVRVLLLGSPPGLYRPAMGLFSILKDKNGQGHDQADLAIAEEHSVAARAKSEFVPKRQAHFTEAPIYKYGLFCLTPHGAVLSSLIQTLSYDCATGQLLSHPRFQRCTRLGHLKASQQTLLPCLTYT